MAYRNGIYIAFAAEGQTDPAKSDIKYYNIMKGWDSMKSKEFAFINSHDKVSAVRDTSKDETIKASLRERLKNSKSMLLLVGDKTKLDDDFVPYEIMYAIDKCKIPIIVCYVNCRSRITNSISENLKKLWPATLKDRIDNEKVKTIHIPFKEKIILEAINNIDFNNPPKYCVSLYKESVYDGLRID
jgi:hypothetical protein